MTPKTPSRKKSKVASIVKIPDSPGLWEWRPNDETPWKTVALHHGQSSGLYCRELRMGGSAECGFDHWNGDFRKEY